MTVSKSDFDDIWNGEKSICFFVHLGKCFWVLDEKYNFSLDAEKDYRAYLDSGDITQSQYDEACRVFRGGVLKMTSDNFLRYLQDSQEKVLSPFDLEGFIDADDAIFTRVEQHFLSGKPLSPGILKSTNVISSRLPKFYINFDRKIFMHMDDGRCHENLAHPDWLAKYCDFGFLIPRSEQYWVVSGNDCWKMRFL